MRRGLLWLAVVDLARMWLRSGMAALTMAAAIYVIALFARQIDLRQAEVLAGYEKIGAATFVAELSGVPDSDIDTLGEAIRSLGSVSSVAWPYSGVELGIAAEVSFQVFGNAQQQEYLGARTSALGVDPRFDLARDYYVHFGDTRPRARRSILGIPLLMADGAARPPRKDAILVASGIANYIGVRPDAEASVELIYDDVTPPIARRFEGLRLAGTFDAAGPDQGRFDPFWRLVARGREVLTVRRPDAAEGVTTSLPTVLSADVIREFLTFVTAELSARGVTPPRAITRSQLVVRARSIGQVSAAEAEVQSLLRVRGLSERCNGTDSRSFCLQLPERNNFQTALLEQNKVGAGGAFFVTLLLALVAVGTAGFQVQTILRRWREVGILQAVGFSPRQILLLCQFQLSFVLVAGIALATILTVFLPSALGASPRSLVWAAGLTAITAWLAALPPLLWPLTRPPAEIIRESV